MTRIARTLAVFGCATLFALGCDSKPKGAADSSADENLDFIVEGSDKQLMIGLGYEEAGPDGNDAHVHRAPHNGALFQLGDHFANIEFTLDAKTGLLTLYALDAHAENAVRLAQDSIKLTGARIERAGGETGELPELVMLPFENALTGEKPGDSSEFRVTSDALKGAVKFSGTLAQLEIKGESFTDLPIQWPAP